MADIVESVDYEVTIGEKRIKNDAFETKSEDSSGNICSGFSFKGKKKGKVEIIFLINLVNGQQFELTFNGKITL